ncbi:hypothetical protein [Nocardioides ultimimeridianus]
MKSDLITTLGTAAAAYGAFGVAAPKALTAVYGMQSESETFTFMSRLWSSRNAALGALALTSTPGARRSFTAAMVAMNGLDAVVALTSRDLPARTRLMAAATSAVFALGSAAVLATDH